MRKRLAVCRPMIVGLAVAGLPHHHGRAAARTQTPVTPATVPPSPSP